MGFEPTVACTTSAFEADALDHYATSPYKHMQWSILHDIGIPSEGFDPPNLALRTGLLCPAELRRDITKHTGCEKEYHAKRTQYHCP